MKKEILPTMLLAAVLMAACSTPEPEPYGVIPSQAQIEWQRMEINMFCHFGPNTFTDLEWGTGEETEETFNPSHLDCGQWVKVAKQAGMKGIIITAKHHDGFCLWPSGQSNHTVAQSPWNKGNGDILAELRKACDDGKMKMGVYISPWDRNDPTYGTAEYNEHFVATLHEVHKKYGPMFEQWFDGANGEGPNDKRQVYDWPLFNSTVLDHNPNAIIFSDCGPGCRWVGNEDGKAAKTCWSTINIDGCEPGTGKPAPSLLETGEKDGSHWIPAECDVSIRPGWFWHANEHPKSVDELMEIYFNSVGHNALLLLNVPPDTAGRICTEDSLRLMEFRAELDKIFAHDLAQQGDFAFHYGRGVRNLKDTAYHTYWVSNNPSLATMTISFDSVVTFDIVMLQEYIPLGQRVYKFDISYDAPDGHLTSLLPDEDDEWTTIGYKRLVRLSKPVSTSRIVFNLYTHDRAVLNRIALYNSAE